MKIGREYSSNRKITCIDNIRKETVSAKGDIW